MTIVDARLEVYRSKSLLRSEKWRWRLVAGNGLVVATSSEGYTNKEDATRMAASVVIDGFYRDAVFSVTD